MINNKTSNDSDTLEAKVLKQIFQLKPEVYANFANQPFIKLPLDGSSDKRVFPLRDDYVRSEISVFAWSTHEFALSEPQMTRILRVLEGFALRNRHCDPALEEAVDADPLLEALNIYLRLSKTNGRFRGNCTDLLKDLNDTSKAYGVDSGHRLWPKGPAQLSQRVDDLKDVLAKANIGYERGRRAGERWIRIELNQDDDDGDTTAS